ncbi:MAG: DUF4911 domain-containing protein [Desulfovibrio sp.]|nr:DUF4911 domain-containing protein [Desulfovibrio sp.]
MLSSCLLVRICPKDIGLFRFLLEAYEHVGYFSVLERHTALLKIVFSPDMEEQARKALEEIAQDVALTMEEYPFAPLGTAFG